MDNEPYDDSPSTAACWVEKFAYQEPQFMLRFEQELIELGLFEGIWTPGGSNYSEKTDGGLAF